MSRLPRNSSEHDTGDREPDLDRLVERVVRELDSPARVIELYYWSRERHLLDIMRSIVAMSAPTREALDAFLAMAADPETIVASLDGSGRLSLSSPQVADALDLMREDRVAMVPEIAHSTH